MRTLQEYIEKSVTHHISGRLNEAYDVYRLNEVIVKYDVVPEDYIVQAPSTYTEDNITLFMADKLFNNVPSSADNADKFFGKNADNIFDVYFEYDGFEHNDETNRKEPNLEWDSHYDKNINNQDVDLENFKLIRLKLVVKFDRFDIQYGSDDNAPKVLEEVFMATVSNDENKYSLELTLDPENIEYSK